MATKTGKHGDCLLPRLPVLCIGRSSQVTSWWHGPGQTAEQRQVGNQDVLTAFW